MTFRIVNGMVVPAEVLPVFRDVCHATKRTVKRRVKNRALALAAANRADAPQRCVPFGARLGFHAVERPSRNLPLQVLPRLLFAHIGDSDPHLDLFAGRGRHV